MFFSFKDCRCESDLSPNKWIEITFPFPVMFSMLAN